MSITVDDPRVYDAFRKRYYDENKTYEGLESAWRWWRNPNIRCAILEAGRGGDRCKNPCEFCRNRVGG